MVFQAQILKERLLFGDKFKTKSLNVYYIKFYMECYNYCQ